MQFWLRAALAVIFLTGCGGGGYIPYAPGSLPPSQIDQLSSDAAAREGISPQLVRAVILTESGGNPAAISRVGAEGLMQLMPGTADDCGVTDAFDPQQNVACGAHYLRSMLDRYHGSVSLAVAAYNAGPGAVDRYHGIPPYPETQDYVVRVLSAYRSN